MIPNLFRTTLPLAALLATLPILPAAAQKSGTAQGMSGMAGMDMSGMDHASMSMQGPMETMPGMQPPGHARQPGRKPAKTPQADCRATTGGSAAASGCIAPGTAIPETMPEAVRER
ncbi:hypothetical protein [Gluconacetobacter takamatsuzukensis]|uniref:Pentapeptide MXKDX repeat protein n=1 Tax=Gluconacetobacter takamatsuzukensis TaxID=1286190 RepID=A0A7W4KEI6_9PROT|nr:hypothetical protein [Gluconacetobacter takamatsuzukensis]MBB2205468.1 hypothetical protein [Gluconacetobacter takamatsuzukensis]